MVNTTPTYKHHQNWVWALCAVYLLGVMLWYPAGFLIQDEVGYYRQALAFLQGAPLLGGVLPGEYPGGTAALMVPFLWLPGKASFFLAGAFYLLASVSLLASVLRRQGVSPLFALLLLVYPAALLASRTAMSEGPSLFIISLFIYLLYGTHTSARLLLIGLLGGLAVWFRESNLLITLPFVGVLFLQTKSTNRWLLPLGVLLGVAVRLLSSQWQFGDPWYLKYQGPYDFGLHHLWHNGPVYILMLLVLVPFGLWAVVRYRGNYRWAIATAVFAVLLLYSCYGYSAQESGSLGGLLLSSRFFVPLLPLFVLALAQWPWIQRLWTLHKLVMTAGLLLALYVSGAQLALNIHSQTLARGAMLIQESTPDNVVPILTNLKASEKLINPFYAQRTVLDLNQIDEAVMLNLWEQYDKVYIVFVIRHGSEFWEQENQKTSAIIDELGAQYHLKKPYMNAESIGPLFATYVLEP